LRAATRQAFPREVIQVLRQEQRPPATHTASLEAIKIGDVDEEQAARFEQAQGLPQKLAGARNMFQYIPHRHGVETGLREIRFLQSNRKNRRPASEQPLRLLAKNAGRL
jgi:hypothetical protein